MKLFTKHLSVFFPLPPPLTLLALAVLNAFAPRPHAPQVLFATEASRLNEAIMKATKLFYEMRSYYQIEGAGNKRNITVLEEDQFITLIHHHGECHHSRSCQLFHLMFSYHPLTHVLHPPHNPHPKKKEKSWINFIKLFLKKTRHPSSKQLKFSLFILPSLLFIFKLLLDIPLQLWHGRNLWGFSLGVIISVLKDTRIGWEAHPKWTIMT